MSSLSLSTFSSVAETLPEDSLGSSSDAPDYDPLGAGVTDMYRMPGLLCEGLDLNYSHDYPASSLSQ